MPERISLSTALAKTDIKREVEILTGGKVERMIASNINLSPLMFRQLKSLAAKLELPYATLTRAGIQIILNAFEQDDIQKAGVGT